MIKNVTTIDTFSATIADGATDSSDLVNTPRDIQFDVRLGFTLASGTVTGNITLQLLSVNADTTEFLPADSDDNRTIVLLSEDLTQGAANYFAKGIDRVAGVSNVIFKITNDSGLDMTGTEITLGKLQF